MFTVYSKTNCKYCETIEQVFKLKDIPYTKYLLGEDYSREEFIAEFGEGSTFPRVLDQDGKLLGGATETVAFLKKEGLV